MRAFYCDHFVLPLPEGHRFPMDKYARLRARVLQEQLLPPGGLIEPPAAAWEDLLRVHTPEYVARVRDGALTREEQRRIGFPWSPAMVERSRRSVGGTIEAARAALQDGASANLAGGTHHAFRDRGEGYCVFNDVAVAAVTLLETGRVRQVAVVDLDVHQGNGTAAIFAHDRRVFTCSLHGATNYPFRKERSDLDVPLPDGTGDEAYLSALAVSLDAVFDTAPDLVFYVAGADPYEGDRLGKMRLTEAGLRRRDAIVLGRCRAEAVPVAVSMAGGYAPDVDAIVRIHAGTIAEAAACAGLWRGAIPWPPGPSPSDASARRQSACAPRH
ncbi:histone deacetylase [Luteitalea sp. TBR-22]|uniref:histone deacetylase family protein n=1 Tax=Luteitalea sp. TBR-22 TaxID=2802971 RepID=UPI001AFB173D|nr:histone deacetylase [Luteitalea sp. TBR-22]BCS35717.1 histone deacetylase [Luteitalea sp. TBR-22]